MMARRTKVSIETRWKVLAATLLLVKTKPFMQVSISEISKVSGITPTTIFNMLSGIDDKLTGMLEMALEFAIQSNDVEAITKLNISRPPKD